MSRCKLVISEDGHLASAGSGTLGRRIRESRERLGWTLKDVGNKTGLNIGYLSRLERNYGSPTDREVTIIAEVLEMEIEVINV